MCHNQREKNSKFFANSACLFILVPPLSEKIGICWTPPSPLVRKTQKLDIPPSPIVRKYLKYIYIHRVFKCPHHEYRYHHHHHTHQSNNQYSHHQKNHHHNRCILSILGKVSWLLEGLKSFLWGQNGVQLNFQSVGEHYRCSGRIRAAHNQLICSCIGYTVRRSNMSFDFT